MQAKLLRFLKEVQRLAATILPVSVRRSLPQIRILMGLVSKRQFREDLFYR